ncbi:MAG: hypothetical protein DCC45_06775 [Armatimonadetes bacterium]|nr:MAG: hypothetical protein DCC45_06775 [Armatimonadota bacterium]
MANQESSVLDQACELAREGRFEDSVALIEAWLGEHPRDAVAYDFLACALHKLGRKKESLSACRKAVFLDPLNPKLLFNLAVALCDQGHRAEALATVEKCLARDPDHPGAQTLRAALSKAVVSAEGI